MKAVSYWRPPKSSNTSHNQIKHRVLHHAVVRPEGEFRKVAVHVLFRDMDMRRANRRFEQVPKSLNMIGRVSFARPVIVVRPILFRVGHTRLPIRSTSGDKQNRALVEASALRI